MEIIVGVSSLKEVKYFLMHGAEEVYCGFSKICNHRMPSLSFGNITQIYEAINIAHNLNKKIFLAVNEIYPEKQYKEIVMWLGKIIEKGIDGIIIRDQSLLYILNKIKLNTYFILSSLALCFNIETLRFYKRFNISQVVLPQQLLYREAKKLIENDLGIKTEIFFYPKCYCKNIDGMCFLHNQELYKKNLSLYPCNFKLKYKNKKFSIPKPTLSFYLNNLYDFYKMGVNYLKISRIRDPIDKINTFRESSALLMLLENKYNKEEFIRKGLKIIRRCQAE